MSVVTASRSQYLLYHVPYVIQHVCNTTTILKPQPHGSIKLHAAPAPSSDTSQYHSSVYPKINIYFYFYDFFVVCLLTHLTLLV